MKKFNMSLMQKISYKLKGQFRAVLAEGEVTDPVPNPAPNPTPQPNPTPNPVPVNVQPTINFEQLIAQARKEEKDKLYPQISTLKATVDSLTNKLNETLLQVGEKESRIQELTKELDKAQKGKADPEELKTLKEELAQAKAEVDNLKGEAERAKLTTFKEAEIAKLSGQVIPELITGTTEEEILASIQASNQRYKELFSQASQGNQQMASPQTPPPANPSVGSIAFDFKTITPEMIRSMNAQDYAKYRAQMGLK